MAPHLKFPSSRYTILDPAVRWVRADEALRETSVEKLMPPLVPQLRRKVKEWRDSGYVGTTDTNDLLDAELPMIETHLSDVQQYAQGHI